MKVTEIRLENLLTLNDKVRQELFNNEIHARNKYFKVLSIYSDGDILLELDDENVEIDIKDIEPIPLTEEWLLKYGFIIREKSYSLNYGGESMKYAILENDVKNPFVLYFHGRFGFNTESGRKNGDFCITNLHQLQNLYFALTNEELTFKP